MDAVCRFMELLAPAKLNLHLRVGPRDASGFHPLSSWFCTVGLFDRLTIRRTEAPGVRFSCDDPGVPADRANLVVRAAESFLERHSGSGVEIRLLKRIAVGAGLGGGSSDAARTLLGLSRLFETRLPAADLDAPDLDAPDLDAIASRLGSDVPFFLRGGSSICTSRGEVVRPAPTPAVRWALLVFPGYGLSTAAVYGKFDGLGLGEPDFAAQPPWQEWAALSARPLLTRLRNDLEPAAFALAPELGRLRDALEQSISRVIRMTGSGSTLFTLFDDSDDAESARGLVRARHSLDAVVVELLPRIDDDLSAEHIVD